MMDGCIKASCSCQIQGVLFIAVAHQNESRKKKQNNCWNHPCTLSGGTLYLLSLPSVTTDKSKYCYS